MDPDSNLIIQTKRGERDSNGLDSGLEGQVQREQCAYQWFSVMAYDKVAQTAGIYIKPSKPRPVRSYGWNAVTHNLCIVLEPDFQQR